jgi:hypothetical protein
MWGRHFRRVLVVRLCFSVPFFRRYFSMNLPRLKLRFIVAIAACILATPRAAKASTLTDKATSFL